MLLAQTVNSALTILRDHPLMAGSTFTQAIALCILDGAGPKVIWDLRLMAADADRTGRRDLAEGLPRSPMRWSRNGFDARRYGWVGKAGQGVFRGVEAEAPCDRC